MFWEKGKENMTERDFFEELKDFDPKNLSGGLFRVYQAIAKTTAVYPKEFGIYYTALGLAGEAGEFANKVKKIMRDGLSITPELKKDLGKELGDCLWYIANACEELGINLNTVADENLEKLLKRKEEGKLHGSGDNR